MTSRHIGTIGALALGIFCVVLAAGCGNRSSDGINTAIRINVYLAEEDSHLDGHLKLLEFHVAVRPPGTQQSYMFDHEATGTTAEVEGRLLVTDPFRLLIREDGDGVMEVLKVFVLAFKDGEFIAWGTMADPEEQEFWEGRVVDRSVILYAKDRVPPPFDWIETGCFYDRDSGILIPSPHDQDCDGVPVEEDCDDLNPDVRPGGMEVCYNGIDDDCDGQTDEVQDEDNDSYTNCDNDCDDNDNTVYPNAPERCDGKDNDCDGLCDDQFDQDGDNFTHCENGTGTYITFDGHCEGPPTEEDDDCAPNDPFSYPGAIEECDGKDNNCDGVCDEGFDQDGDGYTTCGSTRGGNPDTTWCQPPAEYAEDCNDNDDTVHPEQPEICEGKETNCDSYDDPTGSAQLCFTWVDMGQGIFLCNRGTRTCDDTNGIGWGDCESSQDPSDVDNPGILCDLYDDCLISNPNDPYQCLVNQIDSYPVMCHVFSPDNFSWCGQPPTYPLPAPGPNITGCEWFIADTSAAPDWTVQLWKWETSVYVPSGNYADSCDVELEAAPTNAAVWPPPAGIIQLVFVGTPGPVIEIYNVTLNTIHNMCSSGDTMDCNFSNP